ncbi:MAG: LemA family protein [Candidatus Magasanikbacteria bacterium]
MTTSTVIIIVIALVALWLIYAYNSLVRLENRVEEAWADIDIQLKRRYDLIPNLIETVKGYAEHEKEVFNQVTEARSKALSAEERGNPQEVKKAENQLEGALKSLFAVAEDYPDLKSSDNFLELQQELTDTENKIQAARRFYNTNVRDFNTKIESFPYNLIADNFGFKKKELFDLEDKEQRQVPNVNF